MLNVGYFEDELNTESINQNDQILDELESSNKIVLFSNLKEIPDESIEVS